MITLGTSPDPLLWYPIRGFSGCGLYFALCKWIGDDAEEIRIFWYRHDQKFARWFRTLPYGTVYDTDSDMNSIARAISRLSVTPTASSSAPLCAEETTFKGSTMTAVTGARRGVRRSSRRAGFCVIRTTAASKPAAIHISICYS